MMTEDNRQNEDKEMKNRLKKTVKSYICGLAVLSLVLTLTAGCSLKKDREQVRLSVWADKSDKNLFREIADEFSREHEKEADLQIVISEESELSCGDTVLSNPEGAADVFVFADDQFMNLQKEHALLEITQEKEAIEKENGGRKSGAVLAAENEGRLYACPLTAGNGYFLYYNSKYYSKEDVETMGKILSVAEQNEKKFMMDFSSGWYIYSFFKGAGLTVAANADRTQNECNWNATDTPDRGVDVAQSMLSIVCHRGFQNGEDDDFLEGVKNGTVIAGVNGPWNAAEVKKAWGKYYAATKLPTYTLNGRQVQMESFAGYKLVGVNSHTENPEWAMKFARYLSSEKSQRRRFALTGECPSNQAAAASKEVRQSPAVAALAKQAPYSHEQRVCSPFWTAANVYGMVIAGGNKDGQSLQKLLDSLVEQSTGKEE